MSKESVDQNGYITLFRLMVILVRPCERAASYSQTLSRPWEHFHETDMKNPAIVKCEEKNILNLYIFISQHTKKLFEAKPSQKSSTITQLGCLLPSPRLEIQSIQIF